MTTVRHTLNNHLYLVWLSPSSTFGSFRWRLPLSILSEIVDNWGLIRFRSSYWRFDSDLIRVVVLDVGLDGVTHGSVFHTLRTLRKLPGKLTTVVINESFLIVVDLFLDLAGW